MNQDQDLHGEPLPIFQNLPEIDFGADELSDMKRSVHELIHARAVEAAIEEGHEDYENTDASEPSNVGPRAWVRRIPRRVRAARLREATASAGLRVAAGFCAVALATSLLVPSFAPAPLEVAEAPRMASVPASFELSAALAEAESLPLVENLDGATELIQIEDEEMSLVVAAIQ